jgi:protocatechuate 3,4-dioxygenase beta subunit
MLGLAVLLLSVGLLALLAARTAVADTEALGSISGAVRDPVGNPLDGVEVLLYGSASSAYFEQRTTTDNNGAYHFGLLPTGFYRLAFIAQTSNLPSPQYYQDAVNLADATTVAVAGAAVTGVDMVMQAGGTVRGRLVNEAGAPVDQITVYLQTYSGGASPSSVSTDANGAFVFTGVASGYYYLQFIDPLGRYRSHYYQDATSSSDAIIFGVSAGSVVENLNSTLHPFVPPPGASISGQVTDEAGVGVPGIQVRVVTRFDSLRGSATTDAQGNYTVGGLSAGTYRVGYQDPQGIYADSSYSNIESGLGLELDEFEALTNINVRLVKLGMAQGTVTNENGQPLANVQVRARRVDGTGVARIATTDAQGNYLLPGLSLDPQYVDFSQPSGLYQRAYYSDALTIAAATPITVFAGTLITEVNANLALGGAITGVITTVDGSPLGAVRISALPHNQPFTATTSVISLTTASTFTYILGGLRPGDYHVRITGMGGEEYYDNRTLLENATPVAVTLGQFTRNINAMLGDGADSGTISGTVRGPSGQPLNHVSVGVYCAAPCAPGAIDSPPSLPWQFLRSAITDAEGRYQLVGLPPQRYRLLFEPVDLISSGGRYAAEYFDNARDLAGATELDLQPNMVLPNIDATLEPGGTLTGVITYDGGSYPVSNAYLMVYHWDGYQWRTLGEQTVRATGAYTQSALQTGRYRIAARGTLAGESYHYYYGNTSVFTDAVEIAVTAGVTVPNLNIDLPADLFQNAAITGVVTAAGQPVAGIQVVLYRYDSQLAYQTVTDAAGRYTLDNLSASFYYLGFVDPSARYAISYTGGFTTLNSSLIGQIYLESHERLANVNARLLPGGGIQGQVVDEAGRGVGQVRVSVYGWIDNFWRQVSPPVHSDNNGVYRTPGLHPGQYRLYFEDPLGRYRGRYYGDSPTLTYSPIIPVQAGRTVGDIDVLMNRSAPRLYALYMPVIAR